MNQKNTKMANPTLITGFEDVLTFISQQGERIKRLEEQEKKLREITCCAESEKLEDRVSEVVESKNKYFSEVENHEETIDKLQKEIKEYEFESCESVVTTQKVYGQAFAIQAERDKLQKELEEKDDCWTQHIDCLKKEKKELKEELLYYRFYSYTLDRGGDCDLTKEDVDNFTDEEALRKTLYERIGYEEDQ